MKMRLFLDFTLFFSVIILLPLTSALVQPGKTLLTFEKGEGGLMTELRQTVLAALYNSTEIVVLIDCEHGPKDSTFQIQLIICYDSCQATCNTSSPYVTNRFYKKCSSKVLLTDGFSPGVVPAIVEETQIQVDTSKTKGATDNAKEKRTEKPAVKKTNKPVVATEKPVATEDFGSGSGSGGGAEDAKEAGNAHARHRRNDPLIKREKPTEPPSNQQAIPRKSTTGESKIATTTSLGYYTIQVLVTKQKKQEIKVTIETRRDGSYLSARDWPFLPFYGTMSLIYLFFALVWLILCCRNWKDLLRIQFWIGGVIAIGMLENALFYTEYSNINHTGRENDLFFFAEFVSCVKRALARILVIIISMGFGIVKPRLGENLPKVLAVGGIYIVSALVEGVLRVKYGNPAMTTQEESKKVFYAVIPLTVIDVAMCYWVFKALVETTRTLRIRKNVVKLNLYRHFTNTLIFMVVASLAYMVWMIKEANTESKCPLLATVWLNDALWPFLFAIILTVIIFLWRPSKNSRRYENFTPLPEGDEEDDTMTVSDAFGNMKMRGIPSVKEANGSAKTKAEDDLKWVEENIPNLPSTLLPEIDSDEEVMTTKFEQSKMD